MEETKEVPLVHQQQLSHNHSAAQNDEHIHMQYTKQHAIEKYGERTSFKIKAHSFRVDKFLKPLKLLGTGAYGVVCAANDERDASKVAVKKVNSLFGNLTDGKRILRELKLMKHLKGHPTIVQLKDIVNPFSLKEFEDLYMIMELMDTDLHRIIHSKNSLTEEHVKFFTYQILTGLKYMHSANVVHRDIKPSNILVNRNCHIRICDFGLARAVTDGVVQDDDLTEYVVTRWYRAPEIMCSCQEYDARIDIWSVGCILGEILGRKPLFPGDNYIHQLDLIFDALGTPEGCDLDWMNNESAFEYISSLDKKCKIPWRKIFPSHRISDLALELLDHMLAFNPNKRITVDEALNHPWFESVRNPELEIDCPKKFDLSYEQKRMKKRQLQRLIFDEICKYRPEVESLNLFSNLNPGA